jgi:hypothetical protein
VKHEIIVLEDGHRVGVTTVGTAIPLVFLHGFTANRRLYVDIESAAVLRTHRAGFTGREWARGG